MSDETRKREYPPTRRALRTHGEAVAFRALGRVQAVAPHVFARIGGADLEKITAAIAAEVDFSEAPPPPQER